MSTRARTIRGIVLLVVLGIVLVAWSQRDPIRDWWTLRNYDPPPAVAAYAVEDQLTGKARRLLYLNRPDVISDVRAFRDRCSFDERSIVLGCYRGGGRGIVIFGVSDPRLHGVEQVTVAHELLHAAYEELSGGDRRAVDAQLEAVWAGGGVPQGIRDRIEKYEASDRLDELHSIFGTELAQLPAGLESYYARYFERRSAVTSFAAAYRQQFDRLEGQLDAYDTRLRMIQARIDSAQAALVVQEAQMNADRERLEALRSTSRIDEFNAGVRVFNGEVDSHNWAAARLRADAAEYNRLVAERNMVAGALGALNHELDTRVAP